MGLYDLTDPRDRQAIREGLESTVDDDCLWLRSIVEDALRIMDEQQIITPPGAFERLHRTLDGTDFMALGPADRTNIEVAIREAFGLDESGSRRIDHLLAAIPIMRRALRAAEPYLLKMVVDESTNTAIPASRPLALVRAALAAVTEG